MSESTPVLAGSSTPQNFPGISTAGTPPPATPRTFAARKVTGAVFLRAGRLTPGVLYASFVMLYRAFSLFVSLDAL